MVRAVAGTSFLLQSSKTIVTKQLNILAKLQSSATLPIPAKRILLTTLACIAVPLFSNDEVWRLRRAGVFAERGGPLSKIFFGAIPFFPIFVFPQYRSMKPFLTFYLLVALPLLLHSQNNIAVKSFTLLERDMSARIDHPKIDQNGEKAALIKVVTTQTGFEFDGGSLGIVAVVQKTAEVWVYVPRGAKAITIKHPKLGVLRSYPFPIPIVAATVYEMVLVTGTVETVVREAEIETQWLIINTEPVGADVYINDQPAGKTPYQNELPIGKYTWRVSKEMYTTDAGVAELTSALGKSKIDLKLKPNFGKLSITSIPESGATVTLNGMPTGKTTPCVLEPLAAGEHTIGIALEWYETTTRNVTLAVGQTLPLTVEMNPTFVEIAIKTDSIADIYINNQLKSKGTWKGRLNPGVYTFEAKLEGHIPATQKQTVAKGIPVSLFLKPTPKTGTLKVVSNPFDASISLNGKEYGMTPNTIKNLLVGIYTLNIKKKGYGDRKSVV